MIVLDEGRVTQFGHPRKVLPLVEEQLQLTRDTEGEESEGGAMGGATNKGDTGGIQLQVRSFSCFSTSYTFLISGPVLQQNGHS